MMSPRRSSPPSYAGAIAGTTPRYRLHQLVYVVMALVLAQSVIAQTGSDPTAGTGTPRMIAVLCIIFAYVLVMPLAMLRAIRDLLSEPPQDPDAGP